jgi:hypothetical protein
VIHLHPEQVSSRIIMEGYLFKRRYKPKVWASFMYDVVDICNMIT